MQICLCGGHLHTSQDQGSPVVPTDLFVRNSFKMTTGSELAIKKSLEMSKNIILWMIIDYALSSLKLLAYSYRVFWLCEMQRKLCEGRDQQSIRQTKRMKMRYDAVILFR